MNDTITISFVGDIAFFPEGFYSGIEKFNIDEYAQILNSDLSIGNFEFPLSAGKSAHSVHSYESYVAPFESMNILKQFKFTALSLANNHIYDWRDEGIELTMKTLREIGVATFGAGNNKSKACQGFTVERNGVHFAFLSFCKVGKWSASDDRAGAAPLDPKLVLEYVAKYKRDHDHVIVNLHWGVEFSEYPYPPDRELAHRILDAGASCIIGHHPHVVQGVEIYKKRPIFYSTGSFIYSPYLERVFVSNKIEERLISICAKIAFVKNDLVGWEVIPFVNCEGSLFPRKMTCSETRHFVSDFKILSERIEINCDKWFKREVVGNILKRELLTVAGMIISTKGKYIGKLFGTIKLRHLVMLTNYLIFRYLKKDTLKVLLWVGLS